jgi:hypothetical protein
MPVIRTHSGRGRLLAAALWSSAYALLGCTDGKAEPISLANSASAQNSAGRGSAGRGAAGHGSAGRGAAGQLSAGNHGAADGGDGRSDAGNGGPAKTTCDGAPPWSDAYAAQEDDLLTMLNTAIERHTRCADRGTFSRMPFPMMDDPLRCISRQAAYGAFTGITWGKPPSPQQGPGHDPFDPSAPDQVAPWSQMTAASAAMELFSNSAACGKLMSTKYTRVGIGNFASTWVITLAAE